MRRNCRVVATTLLICLTQLPQIYTAYGASFGTTYSGYWYGRATLGQTFTVPPGNNIKVNTFAIDHVFFRGPSWTGCVKGSLYTSTAKTTLLETSTNTICDVDTTGELMGTPGSGTLVFPGNAELSSGLVYYIELSVASGASDFFTGQSSSGANYSGGALFVDGALNTPYDLSFTLSYTTVVNSVVFNSLSISSNIIYRKSTTITANVDSPARLTFYANEKKIPGCLKLGTTGSTPNIVATCSWKPSFRGKVQVYAVAIPASVTTPTSKSYSLNTNVLNRMDTR